MDTDFVAIISDVDRHGRSIALTYGVLRAAFRDSLEHPEPVTPGKTYELHIEISDLAYAFLPGHRVRLCVSSSLFPFFHPHPNTERYADEPHPIEATQTVHRGPNTASRMIVHQVAGPALGSLSLSAISVDRE